VEKLPDLLEGDFLFIAIGTRLQMALDGGDLLGRKISINKSGQ
jgi:hypothetical protein